MYSLGNWAAEGMAFYDRLEVLRGASGLLQGTGSPGGAVNLVRKRGQSEKTVTLTTRAGSWDRYGVQLDVGGPLNAEGTLRGRAVVDEARSHSFVDYVNDRSRSLYAALDYDISPDTTVGLGEPAWTARTPFIYGGLWRLTAAMWVCPAPRSRVPWNCSTSTDHGLRRSEPPLQRRLEAQGVGLADERNEQLHAPAHARHRGAGRQRNDLRTGSPTSTDKAGRTL
jgi:outer membrane receptor protein involved in Fe transport